MPQAWLEQTRETWAQEANRALEQAGRGERIDHRSLADLRDEAHRDGDLERAAERTERVVAQVEEFKQQVAGLVQAVNETAQIHEARLKEAYRQLEGRVNQETQMVFWFS